MAISLGERWILHATDAYLYHDEVHGARRRCPIGMRLYERIFDADHVARVKNQFRLRELVRYHGREVTVFCSHDRRELKALGPAGCNLPQ